MRVALSMSDEQQLTAIFRALSEPLRMDIFRRINEVDELPCTVLEEELPVSKSTISYHMKQLYNAGLIEIRKDGRYYHYRLRRDLISYHMHQFLQGVTAGAIAGQESLERRPGKSGRSTSASTGSRAASRTSRSKRTAS
jgi:DNA-binding transcriptional ArsR family regulator